MISLRKVNTEDASLLVKWFNDKENVKYMNTVIRCKDHSLQSVSDEIDDIDEEYERLFIIESGGKPIGHAGIDDIDNNDKRGEIFFLIGEGEFKGKGYGKEIVRLLLDHGFNKLKLNSIIASAVVDNKKSIKILLDCRFKQRGIGREYNFIDGKFLDEVFFDITLKDYENK